ncbi:hypothetical protein BZK31_07295 [Pseudomonas floridensis]|uniref:Chemotaxis protein n=1 Tax=Pseudomonas floridensis TaxID=1958950 RepID=A0A1X0N8K2_9PSED|nr:MULTISPECIES: hypothetical protein [Pseudomonas]MEE4126566.1 hypothetical protein [Pseudomonas viridiflava]MEE4911971.1 hypothetical protein [Pseudomonas alliivorans]ORC60115.1 hypothetical protein BZK31_07295 [Pseudomonas floridensis]UBT82356.1 hypothetical protein LCH33_005840 [Pseudomonas amygdali]
MQTPQNDTVMDFGPNLFTGEDGDGGAVAAATDGADATNEAQERAGIESHQLTEGSVKEKTAEAGGQAGSSAPSNSNVASGLNTEQAATQPTAGKSEVGTKALSSVKAAVKVFESINGFDEQSATQRTVVRELMLKQSEAMELKLQGNKPLEGEDFDAIAKQLRRENNRLDTLLEGKESLFGKARKAAEIAIENMQGVIAEINRLEEEA